MDQLNDVRLALGAMNNRLKDMGDQLDDLGALATRAARLSDLADDLEALLAGLPQVLRQLAHDPGLSMLLGPSLIDAATALEQILLHRRARRTSAPAIEQG